MGNQTIVVGSVGKRVKISFSFPPFLATVYFLVAVVIL